MVQDQHVVGQRASSALGETSGRLWKRTADVPQTATCGHSAGTRSHGMYRRSLLALAAALPMLLAEPADACSFAIKSPRFAGLQNQQVQKLFEAWWSGTRRLFARSFYRR